MTPSIIAKIIHSNSTEETVDLKSIIEMLGIKITIDNEILDLCHLVRKDGCPTIILNQKLSRIQKMTYVAIAVAEYILTPDRVNKNGIIYDMFFIKGIYHQRFAYRILLATRLAIPEPVITKYCSQELGSASILSNYDFLPEFLRCCVQDSSALFSLQNFSELTQTA